MIRFRHLLLLSFALVTFPAMAAKVNETPIGAAVERHMPGDEAMMQWMQDPERTDTQAGDTLETREAIGDALETVKLSNLVPPIHFETGIAQIPQSTVGSLGEILARMRDRVIGQYVIVKGTFSGSRRHNEWRLEIGAEP